ncbi:hypothetical protein [Psychrobacillus sp.]|uniref:hypothetical protein n=1 Tax=Psychrobacillus sp. TaxID=1871623 RepID=UPI0028BE7FAF|nr:hypothetical protein [Psychrobacillus sp.]
MTFEIGAWLGIVTLLLGIFQFWLQERTKSYLQKKNNEFLEKLRWENKAKEEAAKVAEYLSLVKNLQTEEDYRKVNKLAWELTMWLPSDVYKAMGQALTNPSDSNNELSIIIDIRKILLGKESGNLTQDDVIQHGPGIGWLNKEMKSK